MGTALHRPRPRWWRRWLALLLAAGLGLGLLVAGFALWPHAPLRERLPQSAQVHDRHGTLLRLTLARDQRYRVWTPLEQIDPRLVQAVLLKEDQWFWWHPGFNPVSLLRGGWESYVLRRQRQGGSTLSMQLARLLHGLQTRSVGGKLRQIARAVELELKYSKREILEAYLNYAPFGGNIEGVGAASLIYFGKSAQRLTLPEVLTLAVMPQNPSSRRMRNGPGQAGAALQLARDRLRDQWLASGKPISVAEQQGFALPLQLATPRQLPFAAPHAVEQLLAAQQRQARTPALLRSTLDLSMQSAVEQQVTSYLKRRSRQGLRNAVVMVVDSRDMGVRALLGSADYFDRALHGQVNGARAKRSPGSTLKPFIYALALDQGVLHPQTVLRDVPSSFGPFSPENFDGRFAGPVTATEALVRSRNIPAVQVAARLSSPGFHAFLRDAGVSDLASEQHYGLALVLGGGEVSMLELARLYAMLARDGELPALRWLEADPQAAGPRLLSREAAFLVRQMLAQNPRPDQPLAALQRLTPAWKTGTSWGFRDAWTAGIVGPYVLLVWLGDFAGAGNPALIGIDAAAPLWFELADRLAAREPGLSDLPRPKQLNIKPVEVCAASGDLPDAWCPQRRTTQFIPGVSPIRVSSVHRPVVLDIRTGKAACPPFDPATTRVEVFEYWPSELAQVFIDAGMPRRRPPPTPECLSGRSHEGAPPRITAPLRAVTYTLPVQANPPQQLPLNAHFDAAVRTLYWFAGADFLGAVPAGQVLDWAPPGSGRYTLRVTDDHGRSDSRVVVVQLR